MYDSTIHRELVKTEAEYRLGRVRNDIAGRRVRRAFAARFGTAQRGDVGDTTFGTAR